MSVKWQPPLQWCYNDHDGVSNHQPHGCLHNHFFRRRSKKTSKLRVTGLCVGIHRNRWIPRTKGQLRVKCFHLMTSSWHCLGLKVLKHRGSLFEWVHFQSYFYLGAVWIQFGAIWINVKTLSVIWRSHCLGLNVLTYCGQFLVVSIWQSTLPNQFPNLGARWIKYCFHTIVWRMAAVFRGLNVLTNCCWSKVASILQTTS